jgi:2'-hydroxyisoflavone reductase
MRETKGRELKAGISIEREKVLLDKWYEIKRG